MMSVESPEHEMQLERVIRATLNSQHQPLSTILTDSPAVVELKRQFRALDEREQALKEAIERIREEKRKIGTQIFAAPQVVAGMV